MLFGSSGLNFCLSSQDLKINLARQLHFVFTLLAGLCSQLVILSVGLNMLAALGELKDRVLQSKCVRLSLKFALSLRRSNYVNRYTGFFVCLFILLCLRSAGLASI